MLVIKPSLGESVIVGHEGIELKFLRTEKDHVVIRVQAACDISVQKEKKVTRLLAEPIESIS